MKKIRRCLIFLSITTFFLSSGIYAAERLRMATTTSVENSGLLDVLLPHFERQFNIKVDVIATGSGKALKLAENGDVDIILTHAPIAEDNFMRQGFGVDRYEIMYNYFVLIGPEDDPAGIKGNGIYDAFRKIAAEGIYFISRGDESGTHKKEKQLWHKSGLIPKGKWYLETGQGMAATLMIADEKQAYCFCDYATFTALKDKIKLTVLSEDTTELFNPYSVIAVNPKRHPRINHQGSLALISWLRSSDAQEIIAKFERNGETLFDVYRD